MNDSPLLIGLLDLDGRTRHMNHVAEHWMGRLADSLFSAPLWQHAHWASLPGQAERLQQAVLAASQGRSIKIELRLQAPGFPSRQIELSLRPLRQTRQVDALLLEARDVSVHRQAQEKLMLAAAVFEQAREGIMITDPQGVILSVNRAFSDITGFEASEISGQFPPMLSSTLDGQRLTRRIRTSLLRSGHWQGEIESLRKSGHSYTAWVSITRRVDAEQHTTHLICILNDISQSKQAERQLLRQAHYDALTELPNRHLLVERLRQTMLGARRHSQGLALLFIDLNQFRHINEHFGHDAGDTVLLQLAARLRESLREVDTVARLGGDEFAVLLPGTDSQGAAQVAAKLINRLAEPCKVLDQDISLTASIGIALYPVDADEPEAMLRCADTAMYRAKQDGRGQCCFYTADMQLRSARQMLLEAGLRRAVERGELLLHYQPQLDLASGQVVGLEALVRWKHPELGMISPAEFIPLAESSGQILALGAWVLRTAVDQMKQWLAAGLSHRVVAVNLSALQFKDPGLPELVRTVLEQSGLPPACLELELTESVATGNPDAACAVLNRLHALGVRLSIDDFGTGYSSLNHLKRFPIHTLKIDQSFVRDIHSDPDDRAIVQAIIQLAHALRLTTIAEGVETTEQADFLRAHGCDMVQGYHYCRPQPPQAALAWMQQHDSAGSAAPVIAPTAPRAPAQLV